MLSTWRPLFLLASLAFLLNGCPAMSLPAIRSARSLAPRDDSFGWEISHTNSPVFAQAANPADLPSKLSSRVFNGALEARRGLLLDGLEAGAGLDWFGHLRGDLKFQFFGGGNPQGLALALNAEAYAGYHSGGVDAGLLATENFLGLDFHGAARFGAYQDLDPFPNYMADFFASDLVESGINPPSTRYYDFALACDLPVPFFNELQTAPVFRLGISFRLLDPGNAAFVGPGGRRVEVDYPPEVSISLAQWFR